MLEGDDTYEYMRFTVLLSLCGQSNAGHDTVMCCFPAHGAVPLFMQDVPYVYAGGWCGQQHTAVTRYKLIKQNVRVWTGYTSHDWDQHKAPVNTVLNLTVTQMAESFGTSIENISFSQG
jgi:hypothetical protein